MPDTLEDFPPLDDLLKDAEYDQVPPPEPSSVDDAPPKRTRKKRSDAGVPRGPRGSGSSGGRKPRGGMSTADKKLAEELLSPWAKICTALAMFAPTVSGVMAQRGEATMNGVVSLASPKMKDALTKAAKTGPGLDLAETVLMIVIAAAVDFGKLEPNSPVAYLTGVRSVYAEVHPEGVEAPQEPPPGSAFPGMENFGMYPGAVE